MVANECLLRNYLHRFVDGCRNTLDESYRHVVKYTVAFNEDIDKLNIKERLIFFDNLFLFEKF